MKKRIWIVGLAAVSLTAGLFAIRNLTADAAQIPNGLFAGDQSLGGMEPEEAQRAVSDYVGGLEDRRIILDVDGMEVETTARELGFHWSNQDEVRAAIEIYTGGNLLKQYMAMKDLEHENVTIPLDLEVDEQKVAAFVAENCQDIVQEAKDAAVARENGQFVVAPSVTGKTIDPAATKKAVDAVLAAGQEEPVRVTAAVTAQEPRITTEMLSTIQDVLGTYTTDFSSSGASRSTNLKVGAGKINGHVLLPGETLSGYECMQPFTTENGYATAAAYENGQVVDSVGGGVCQIATTLYNAALLAEVEITQRQNHSMVVGYVKPSMDAAIAGTYKDIKISNNYSTPIYVEGYTSGKQLTFTIYGKETRPANRTIEYISETLGTTDPGAPITKVDTSMAPGARKQVQSAHRGLKSRLWKCVYVDGVETERTLLHTDTYTASKAIVMVGPEAPAAAPPATSLPQENAGQTPAPTAPAETPSEGDEKGPGAALSPGGAGGESAGAPSPQESAPAAPAQSPDPVPTPDAPAAQPAA